MRETHELGRLAGFGQPSVFVKEAGSSLTPLSKRRRPRLVSIGLWLLPVPCFGREDDAACLTRVQPTFPTHPPPCPGPYGRHTRVDAACRRAFLHPASALRLSAQLGCGDWADCGRVGHHLRLVFGVSEGCRRKPAPGPATGNRRDSSPRMRKSEKRFRYLHVELVHSSVMPCSNRINHVSGVPNRRMRF